MKSMLVCLAFALLAFGCGRPVEDRSTPSPAEQPEATSPIEATSLLGESLARPELPEDFRLQQEALLSEAEAEQEENPEAVEPWIWVGRRTAYLGRYGDAIDIYTRAIEQFPDEARLYRHRGHRLLSTRQLDRAIADFERAADLFKGEPDRVEPDGLPNDRGIPTSTLQSNVWYHLGLAQFLKGDFDAALDAYEECLKVSNNPDMLVATTYWTTMTLQRLDRDEEAQELLASIEADMDIIENRDYHRLLLMAKGQGEPENLLAEAREGGGIGYPSTGFGVGHWYLIKGDPEKAIEVFREVVSSDSWAAFGFIAAEAELARIGTAGESE